MTADRGRQLAEPARLLQQQKARLEKKVVRLPPMKVIAGEKA